MFLKLEVEILGSIPREIAGLSADFQFTVQKNEIKYFVLKQINKNKQKRRMNLLTCLKAFLETVA